MTAPVPPQTPESEAPVYARFFLAIALTSALASLAAVIVGLVLSEAIGTDPSRFPVIATVVMLHGVAVALLALRRLPAPALMRVAAVVAIVAAAAALEQRATGR